MLAVNGMDYRVKVRAGGIEYRLEQRDSEGSSVQEHQRDTPSGSVWERANEADYAR
jgi:hypothetical protein